LTGVVKPFQAFVAGHQLMAWPLTGMTIWQLYGDFGVLLASARFKIYKSTSYFEFTTKAIKIVDLMVTVNSVMLKP